MKRYTLDDHYRDEDPEGDWVLFDSIPKATAVPWYIIYDGTSPDGRGPAYFVRRTTDQALAKKYAEKFRKDPYCTGYVQKITNKGVTCL